MEKINELLSLSAHLASPSRYCWTQSDQHKVVDGTRLNCLAPFLCVLRQRRENPDTAHAHQGVTVKRPINNSHAIFDNKGISQKINIGYNKSVIIRKTPSFYNIKPIFILCSLLIK